jgi:hypothetical protein
MRKIAPLPTFTWAGGELESGHSRERRASLIRRAWQLAQLLLEPLEIDRRGDEFIVTEFSCPASFLVSPRAVTIMTDKSGDAESWPLLCQGVAGPRHPGELPPVPRNGFE